MKQSDQGKYIETNYDVEGINYNGLKLWLEIRNRFFAKMFIGEESSLKINNATYFAVLGSLFYGFFNWFKSYDTWFFSSTINRLEINNIYVDRLFEYTASRVNKPLFIELTTSRHYKRRKIASKAIVSRSPLTLIEKILSLFINVKKIDLSVYEEIQRYSGVDYDPTYTIKKMIAQYTTMKWLLKLKKPKVAFISPAYTAFGYVKALKESGVIVVEMQHGLILKSHHGYNVYTAFDQSYFPDYLLSFGKREKDVFDEENKSLSSNQIIPVGNFFLDHVTENYKEEGFTEQQSESYKLSIAVSLQEIELGEKLIPFIIDLANANQDVVFYLKPRRRPKAYFISKYDFPNNTVIVEHVNIYELILNTDCHATIFSTTALEAPALGRQNVLVNINNKAKEIFGDTLTNSSTTVFVDDIASFQNFIDSFQKIPSEQIKQEHEDIIASNFKNNVNQFLKRVYA